MNGTIRRRSREEVLQNLHLFTVVERESKVFTELEAALCLNEAGSDRSLAAVRSSSSSSP